MVGERKLAVNPAKSQTILCQVSPMNFAADHKKIGKNKSKRGIKIGSDTMLNKYMKHRIYVKERESGRESGNILRTTMY
jgi:hypothetical protein